MSQPFVFKINELEVLADQQREGYQRAEPFPHVVLDDFLPKAEADRVLDVFPDEHSGIWFDHRKQHAELSPRKQGIGHASRLAGASPVLQNMLQAFNAYPFLNFLEKLTGIEKLLPDPHFYGGGIHQTLSGGRLAIHTDFNHLAQLDLYRRLNVLLYLNKDWKSEYRGEIELWDEALTACVKSVEPLFNRLVVFTTNKKSFHGHPAPLNTPEHITRKSLAFYYYTAKPEPGHVYDGKTNWPSVS